MSKQSSVLPHQLSHEPQVAFNDGTENSFGQWANAVSPEEHIVCAVNTAQAALDLVAAGVGICVISEDCIQSNKDIVFVPMKNWYQALYMCILYDKWLEPPIWGFVDELVKVIRRQEQKDCP